MKTHFSVLFLRKVRWLALGLVLGSLAGYGATQAEENASSPAAGWQSHATLSASALNLAFSNLREAIERLEQPECPAGYLRDVSNMSIVICVKGVDQLVRVGSGGAVFWIDRYEASIWERPDGSGQQYGLQTDDHRRIPNPDTFPDSGQYATPLYALSIRSVTPAAWSTWFLAAAACEASGKRLPTNLEWIRAARSTLDPGVSAGTSGTCNTYAAELRKTGLGVQCVSRWGAEDMIGNMDEVDSEWQMKPATEATSQSWPELSYNLDALLSIVSSATDWNAYQPGVPSATSHGSNFNNYTNAGTFNLGACAAPTYGNRAMGFRCVVDR